MSLDVDALPDLNSRIERKITSSDLNQAAAFATEAQTMMDNQLRESYIGIKYSVVSRLSK